MALQIEQLSPTQIWVHDGPTSVAVFDSSAGVQISALTVGAGNDTALTSTSKELNVLDGIASTVTVSLLAATAANGMDITITAKDAAGTTVAAAHQLEFWMSEAATGIGLTGDTYSGDLVATTGAILSAHTAKKHWSVSTAATGIFVATLTADAKPADQYVAIKKPVGAALVVSAASGALWGA
jgi:hypothetical protein